MHDLERSYRLLIVDDDEVDQALYARLLERRAPGVFDLRQAGDGAAALGMLAEGGFDCVLLDFRLPDMTGLEFLEAASEGAEGLRVAVVVVTGQGTEAVAVEAMKRGAQDYLVKGQVNENSLWRSITRAVMQKELRLSLARTHRDLRRTNAALGQEVATRRAAEVALRAAKRSADQANLAKTRFVAMMTHELRTPLNGILGYAQLLRMEGGLTAAQIARVEAITRAGRHLIGTIEHVLDFASIETGHIEFRPEPVAVTELAEACLAVVAPIAAEHGLSLRLVAAPAAPERITTDPARLRQVLLNLLGNAVKFTREGGVELRLAPGATPGGLLVEVADTGIGVAPDQLCHLFQEFERIGTAPSVEGAGLGLSIVARLVRLMGGQVSHAPNPGGGSLFRVDLPDAGPPAADASHPGPPAAAGRALRVLVVDDIRMNRDLFSAFLDAAGHVPVVVDGGAEAVRRAAAERFDLVLMDVLMAEMDGLEATRRIRALPPPHGQVPILALTASAFPEQVALCRAAGMDGHVGKPVDFAALLGVIGEVMGEPLPAAQPGAAQPAPAPRLDRAALEAVRSFAAPGAFGRDLGELQERTTDMLRLLDLPAPPALLAATAHGLVSAAGMFGFAALCEASRRFEHATSFDEPAAPAVGAALRAEALASLELLGTVLREEAERAG